MGGAASRLGSVVSLGVSGSGFRFDSGDERKTV